MKGLGEPSPAPSKWVEASDPCSPGMAPLRVPRCPSPSCCTPYPTNCMSSSHPGPCRCPPGLGGLFEHPQGHGICPPAPVVAGLGLALESGSHSTAWPVARRPHGANVRITVRFKGHPAGYHGNKCWAKENQECWTGCNCRRGRWQKV